MSARFTRRQLLKGGLAASAAMVVAGFDPRRRSWVTAAEANPGAPLLQVPPLDGVLQTDAASTDAFSGDFGRLISRRPRAVLEPGSIDDIATMVRFARHHRLTVAVNGQAGTDDLRESHSSYGQALVGDAGIAIDPKPLAQIYSITEGVADVGAGAQWDDVFNAAIATGQTPAMLTDFLHLSVGGTLSIGGTGGTMQKHGAQVDNVLEVTVVTGRGDVVTASPTAHRGLFSAVLGGAGQCAILVRVKLRLVPAKTHVRLFSLFYDDLATYLADQETVLADGRFSYQEGQIVRRPDNTGWQYMIEAAAYFTPPAVPDDAALLAGLRDDRAAARIETQTYREHAFRVDPLLAILKLIGRWGAPHPWLDVFIPASRTAEIVRGLVDRLEPDNVGTGVLLLYPFDTRKLNLPLFRVPDEPVAYQLSLLRFPPPGDPDIVATMLALNRRLFDEITAVGGKRYLNGAVPDLTRRDWHRHYQPEWGFLVRQKRHFDPDNVLTPGQGIFRRRHH